MNITEPIRAIAERDPDAPAYLRTQRGDVPYTYRQYDAMLDAIGWRALDAGVRPGQRVGLLVERDFAFLTITLALARVGIETVKPETIEERCDAFVASPGAPRPPGVMILDVDGAWFEPPARAWPAPMHPGGDQPCLVVRTSGTTGRPKVIEVTHAQVVARVQRRLASMALPKPLRMMSKVRVRALYGMQVALATLWEGGLRVEPAELDQVAAQVRKYAVSWLVTPPGVLEPVIASIKPGDGPFPSLKRLEVSGSILTERLATLASERLCPDIIVLYGATETGVVAQSRYDEIKAIKGAVGRLVPDVEADIVDERGTPLPPGTEGILRIRAPGLATGYVGDEAASRAFRDGWYYSGDVASLSTDGVLAVRGRADERLNIGGNKIAPEEIEAVVQEIPGIEDVAAFGVTLPSAGIERVAMAIVAGPGFDYEVCKAICRERLGLYTPDIVLRVRSIPRNENGKVERTTLARLAVENAPAAGRA